MQDDPTSSSRIGDADEGTREFPKSRLDSGSLSELLSQLAQQTDHLSKIRLGVELDACLLDKIARITCLIANETHEQTQQLKAIRELSETLVELYKSVHPDQALQLDNLTRLRAELEHCCPPEDKPDPICVHEPCKPHGGVRVGDGYSTKSTSFVNAVEFSEEPHEPWQIVFRGMNEADEHLPIVAQGDFVGQIVPSPATPRVLDLRSAPGGAPGAQAPVGFRTFSETGLAANYPPDMSGARGGDVVLMSGNLWLKMSVDGGKTFTDLDFTTLFAADTTYGGWAGDQVIHYLPAIDCFVLYVQSNTRSTGTNMNKNVVKVALASSADLKKFAGGRDAWSRQWDLTSDTFGLGASWMDFPDISYGEKYLFVNTNVFAGSNGKLFFELPLADMQAGRNFSFKYGFFATAGAGSPIQNIQGDDNYWAAHVNNSTMRIYSSRGGDPNYSWRDRQLRNWAKADDGINIISAAPDSSDWIGTDHRIIGATRVGTQLWFAWSAAKGNGGGGGFDFPHAHIEIAKYDLAQDFKLIEQAQVWNADHAFSYPCLTTNSDNEVGISLAFGGIGGATKYYGSHAVGILGDFVVWYGALSDTTVLRQEVDASGNLVVDGKGNPVTAPTRFGDYLQIRLAHPDTRFFGAFGYSVKKDATMMAPNVGRFDYAYVEFGREKLVPAVPR